MVKNVIKRDGRIVLYNQQKIFDAIKSAFIECGISNPKKDEELINKIVESISAIKKDSLSVEEIQDLVELKLMASNRKDVAKAYILYRDMRSRIRGNLTDKTVLDYLAGNSEYWNGENSNKDPKVVTVQRDYLAGITSTDIARRFILPPDICEAHDEGIIHQHDMDYLAQNALNNCSLINLEDILKNGTSINGVQIDPQKRLSTATTVATQVITAVASSEYGGTTVTVAHLAPYVRMSYEEYYRKYKKRGFSDSLCREYAEEDLATEVKASVQTFNYQVNSMSTTNGQAPFLSVNLWVNENPEYKEESALLIKEFLEQRILGMKNEKGVYVTPAFPKLLYVLDEDNTNENGKYWYLTELAAKCTAKRMVPDYISAKKMREYKINHLGKGDVYPCMG